MSGWAMAGHLRAELALAALDMAMAYQSRMAFEATRPIPGPAEQQVAASVIINCP